MSFKNTDLDKITQTVQYYFDGLYHSDTEALKKAFDPDAFLHGYFDGRLVHAPFDAWLKQVEDRPAEVRAVFDKYAPEDTESPEPAEPPARRETSLADDEILRAIEDSKQAEKFQRLFDGGAAREDAA